MEDINSLRQDILDRIQDMEIKFKQPEDKKYKTKTQEDILSRVKYFLEKFEGEPLNKSLIDTFLKGYKQLSLMGSSYIELDSLLGLAIEVNIQKGFDLHMDGRDNLAKVIFIDSVAHNLHQEKIYPILDELADISKAFGEEDRNDRMIILSQQDKVQDLESLNSIKIMTKGLALEASSGMWGLVEKAIKKGIEALSDHELVLLREWIFCRI